jgi:hypothetical protein
MALKLRKRELPTVTFRRVLPEWLGPGTDKDPVECFIAFEARAGGSINPMHVELVEKSLLNARVMRRKTGKIEDDKEFIQADHRDAEAINMQRFAALYDACVIEWFSNIQTEGDDGEMTDITCDRETFLELCQEKVPEIGAAILDFEKQVRDAGEIVSEDDDETAKN